MNQFSWNGSFPSQDLRFIQSKFVVQIYVMILGWYQLVPNPIYVYWIFLWTRDFQREESSFQPRKKVILCFIFPLGICKKVLTLILFKNWILFSLNASFCFVWTIVFSKKSFLQGEIFLWFLTRIANFARFRALNARTSYTDILTLYKAHCCTVHLTLYNAQFIYCKLYFWIWTLYKAHLQRTFTKNIYKEHRTCILHSAHDY